MIHAIEVENFKGVANRQRIEFAPLTLLFGANNAGKSTILHALLYLHELVERGSADVDHTELGGTSFELGGFARLVHRHDPQRSIVLRAEFDTPGSLLRFGRDLGEFPFVDLDDDVGSAWVELHVRHRSSPGFQGPIVDRVVVGVNGDPEPLVSIATGRSLSSAEPLYAQVNLWHPILRTTDETHASWSVIAATEHVLLPSFDRDENNAVESSRNGIPAQSSNGGVGQKSTRGVEGPTRRGGVGAKRGAGVGAKRRAGIGPKPALGDTSPNADVRHKGGRASTKLPVFLLTRGRMSALPSPADHIRVVPLLSSDPESEAIAEQVRTFLEMVVLGTTTQLGGFLRESLYIGPLRAVPGLADLYERPASSASWGDGRASWQALLRDRSDLVARTNAWLTRLGADCRVFVASVFEPTSGGGEAVGNRLHTLRLETHQQTRVLPAEVGAGISQMVPVVVAALLGRGGALAVEQPELHVHPALQTGLGDLFIEAATRERPKRLVLVETHSEHLILRVLRRIRETSENELEGAKSFTADLLSVVYIESTPDGSRFRRLRVDEHGEFTDRWPRGFFEERTEELF